MTSPRVALASALLGAVGALTIACSTVTPTPMAAPSPVAAPVAVAPPAAPVAASPTTKSKPKATTTAKAKAKGTGKAKGKTAAECERIGNESTKSNADLYPYLRSIGCGRWLDSAIDTAEQQNGGPGAHSDGYDQNGDGVYNGYERCGTSCGEEPTSGELQYQDGCEQGYIPASQC